MSYEPGPVLERAVQAVLASRFRPLEVIVVDNGSRDGAARGLADSCDGRLQMLFLGSNRGFAGAVNAAIDWRETRVGEPPVDVYALVNPDCFVEPGWLGPLVAVLTAEPSVAVVGGLLYDSSGSAIEHAGAVVRANGLTEHRGRGCRRLGEYERPAEVDYVTGAMCAFRASTWHRLGGFDAGYFPAYFEETDFCLRARSLGMRVVYEPAARGIHLEAVSLGKKTDAFFRVYHRNRVRFAARHLLRRGRWLAAVSSELGWLAGGGARGSARAVAAAYARLPIELWAARRARSSEGACR
ncbi:MAG: glycosyltransferase family 2 protein [Deltaproteobacteria bacterium]|nr:MAG: glycosyltransferase family 2 protein [Deltaproteobacteria bacterium]